MQKFPHVGMTWTDMTCVDADGKLISPRYIRVGYSAWRRWREDQLFQQRHKLGEIAPALREVVGEASFGIGDFFTPLVTGSMVHTSTVVMRRDRLERLGGFREDLLYSGEDYDFHLRTCREGLVGFCDISTITYQRGRADQLTNPKYDYWLKINFLKTLEPILAVDRARIDLPQSVIDGVLAEGHCALGEVLLIDGRRAEARRALLASLRLVPMQPRTAWLLLNASLPGTASELLRGAVRRARRRSA